MGVPPSPALAQSEFVRHATQAFVVVSQTGRPAVVQSVLLRQPARHVPLLQMGVPPSPAVVQSEFARHATQLLFVVSQSGRAAFVHSELLRQPARHAPLLQMGVPPSPTVAQSEFARHVTQRFVVVSQCVVFPVQAVASEAVHWMQLIVVVSQIGARAVHAPAPPSTATPGRQPTHAPVDVSQTSPLLHRAPPSTAHEAWQL
jgi:hypothetical protein